MLGHDFAGADEQVVELAIALDPRSGRLPARDWAARSPAIRRWLPDHRYDRTGDSDRDPQRLVEDLVTQAREAVDACVTALLVEGRLDIESLR